MTFSFCFFLFYLYLGFNVSLIRNKLSVIFCLSPREVVQRRIWKGCLFVSTKDYLVCFRVCCFSPKTGSCMKENCKIQIQFYVDYFHNNIKLNSAQITK